MFFYKHLTPDGVMGVFLPSLWELRPMDNIPTIMHYELCITNYKGPPSAPGETKKRDAALRRLYIQNILKYYPTSQPLATSLLGEITTSLPSLFTADMIIP